MWASALSAGVNGDSAKRKSAVFNTGAPTSGDLEEGGISGSPGRIKEQGG